MKLFIASDIHGSAYYCRKTFEAYDKEGADRMLLLGDFLYHGPRNDLPQEYDPKAVLDMLNERKGDFFCIHGNCDAEVDQLVLDFPMEADYCILMLDCGRLMYATHGHKYMLANLPLKPGDIYIQGHTHVPRCTVQNGILSLNPGSVAIPKENSHHEYMLYENGVFVWKDFAGNVLNRYDMAEHEAEHRQANE